MKKLFYIFTLFCIFNVVGNGTLDKIALRNMLPEKIASINGKVIDNDEFINFFIKNLPYGKIPKYLDGTRAKYLLPISLKNFIDEKLIAEYLLKNGVKGTPQVVEKYYSSIFKKLTDDEKNLLEYKLKQQKTSLDKWIKTRMQNPLIQQNIANYYFFDEKFTKKVVINEADIKKYYYDNAMRFSVPEMVDISNIRVSFNPKNKASKANALKKIEQISKELEKNPKKFDDFAKNKSDSLNAKYSGKIGAVTRETLDKNVGDIVFKLKDGQISKVITSNNAYHLIRKNSYIGARKRSYDEVKNEIKDMLTRHQVKDKVNAFFNGLKKDNKVEIFFKVPDKLKVGM